MSKIEKLVRIIQKYFSKEISDLFCFNENDLENLNLIFVKLKSEVVKIKNIDEFMEEIFDWIENYIEWNNDFENSDNYRWVNEMPNKFLLSKKFEKIIVSNLYGPLYHIDIEKVSSESFLKLYIKHTKKFPILSLRICDWKIGIEFWKKTGDFYIIDSILKSLKEQGFEATPYLDGNKWFDDPYKQYSFFIELMKNEYIAAHLLKIDKTFVFYSVELSWKNYIFTKEICIGNLRYFDPLGKNEYNSFSIATIEAIIDSFYQNDYNKNICTMFYYFSDFMIIKNYLYRLPTSYIIKWSNKLVELSKFYSSNNDIVNEALEILNFINNNPQLFLEIFNEISLYIDFIDTYILDSGERDGIKYRDFLLKNKDIFFKYFPYNLLKKMKKRIS